MCETIVLVKMLSNSSLFCTEFYVIMLFQTMVTPIPKNLYRYGYLKISHRMGYPWPVRPERINSFNFNVRYFSEYRFVFFLLHTIYIASHEVTKDDENFYQAVVLIFCFVPLLAAFTFYHS